MSDFDAWVNRANDLQGEVNQLEEERDTLQEKLITALGEIDVLRSLLKTITDGINGRWTKEVSEAVGVATRLLKETNPNGK